jgi:hypothetical protein
MIYIYETQRYNLFSYHQNFFNKLSTFFFHSVENFFNLFKKNLVFIKIGRTFDLSKKG